MHYGKAEIDETDISGSEGSCCGLIRVHMNGTVLKLKYGNTNTFYLPGTAGNLLVDTDTAGTLPAFYREIKQNGIRIPDITCVMATHYHPDHCGLIGELEDCGVRLLLIDVQVPFIHFADRIFSRERRLGYKPPDGSKATVINCAGSREFLSGLGIGGEIIHTPSHSRDSVSLILDSGICIAGDLEPYEYLEAYGENPELRRDWDLVLGHHPKRILYAHAKEKSCEEGII